MRTVPNCLKGGEERGLVAGPGDVETAFAKLAREPRDEGGLESQLRELLAVGEDLGRRALEHDAPVVHHDDAVGGQGLLHEVRDVHDGGALVAQLGHHAHDAATSAHVEQGARLVQHEHARLHGKRAGDGNALLLSARQARRVAACVVGHRHAGKLALHARADLVGRDAQVLGAKGHVLLDD